MAYSFTDYGPEELSAMPAMVPMADILNHVSNNNAQLEFGEDCLSMVTTQAIEKVNTIIIIPQQISFRSNNTSCTFNITFIKFGDYFITPTHASIKLHFDSVSNQDKKLF